MPYSITTKDGITVNNIPDDVPPDAPQLKERVAKARAGKSPAAPEPTAPTPEGIAAGPPPPSAADQAMAAIRANPTDQLTRGFASALGDKALGVRQFFSGITGENPEELKQKAIEREAAQKQEPFLARAGNVAGTMIPEMLVGTGIAQGASKLGGRFLPKIAEFMAEKGAKPLAARTAAGMGAGAVGGAADAPFNPTTGDETPFERMISGAKWGAAGNLGGRMLGGLWAPFSNAKPSAASVENIATMAKHGVPSVTPAVQLGPGMVQSTTNALEQIPILGVPATKRRNETLEWLTRNVTKEAGHEVPILTGEARQEMRKRLEAQGTKFRAGPDVDVSDVEKTAKKAAADVLDYAEATSQTGGVKKLEAAGEAAAGTKPKYAPGPGGPVQVSPGTPATRTADEVMDLRRAASELAYKTDDPVLAAQYRKLRNSYDDALKATMTKPEDFDLWRKQWGNMEDVAKIAKKGTEGGRLLPHHVADVKSPEFAPFSEQGKLYHAMAEQMPARPGGWNRALATSLLLGAPLGTGAVGGMVEGEPGAVVGGGAGLALMSALSRKAPSKAQLDAIRRFMTTAAITEKE